MPATRNLIVNGDDFGLSSAINRGIIRAHEQGILTSASLMVRALAAVEAVAYARLRPQLAVGLHLDLGEWVYRDGEWRLAYQVVPLDNEQAVAEEIERQFGQFSALMGRSPTHLDSHQHVHRSNPIHDMMLAKAKSLQVVLRSADAEVQYCGDFYGQTTKGEPYPEGISVEALLRILTGLPPGTTELGCHPADGPVASVYSEERSVELESLCHPFIRQAILDHGISLRSFASQVGKPIGS